MSAHGRRMGAGPVGQREGRVAARRRRDGQRADAYVDKHGDYRARREEHLAMLGEALEALEDARGMRDWVGACALKSASTDNYYSAKNAALLAWQAPGATHVRGLKAWRAAGATVEKGQGSIRLTGPGGRVFHVFEVSQTDAASDPTYGAGFEPVEDAARLEELEELAARELEGSAEELALAAAIVAAREGIAAGELPPADRNIALAAHALAAELAELAPEPAPEPASTGGEAPAPAAGEAFEVAPFED